MADEPITGLAALSPASDLAEGDLLALADISDTAQSANGTTKKIDALGFLDNAKITNNGTVRILRNILNNIGTIDIPFIIDGGGFVIETGIQGAMRSPIDATITGWELVAPIQSGSIIIDLWKDSAANFPPDNADSIAASALPTLTTAQRAASSTLTGWTTSITAGDWIIPNVDSVTSLTFAVLILKAELA